MTVRATNWAGNLTFGARRWHRPGSVEELQQLVAGAVRVRAVGTGHSFSRLADSDLDGDLLATAGLPPSIALDPAGGVVTVGAGVRYGELAVHLHQHGYALRNLASLPHISVAGACATASHGSGVHNGSLASAVRALQLVTGDGDLVTLRQEEDGEQLDGAVVALGALGIVTSLTLEIVPAYEIRQYVYENLPRKRMDDHFEEIVGGAYSVSMFTDWTGPRINQVWVKQRTDEPGTGGPGRSAWLDATLADGPRHPVPGMPVINCTEQGGVAGPWHARLPHFRMEFTPSSGEELQSEYLLPREHAVEALTALDRVQDRIAPILQISEVRTVASDQHWLSPSYRRDSVAIHFTWVKDEAAVSALLPAIEERLAPFGARPHWGKLFAMTPEVVADRYQRLADFRRLRDRYDPTGKFRNPFVDRYLG